MIECAEKVEQTCRFAATPGRASPTSSEMTFGDHSRAVIATSPAAFQVGTCLVDGRTGIVHSPTGQHRLRAKELALLKHLRHHADVTFTRDQLLDAVWNCEPGVLTRTVDQTVATLRKKIEAQPRQPRFLQTVYGIGYRLVL